MSNITRIIYQELLTNASTVLACVLVLHKQLGRPIACYLKGGTRDMTLRYALQSGLQCDHKNPERFEDTVRTPSQFVALRRLQPIGRRTVDLS